MSDNLLTLIPLDPQYIPSEKMYEDALQILRQWQVSSTPIAWEVSTHIRFFDAGINFNAVFCPLCEQPISLSWWQQAMDAAFQTYFTQLTIVTPCCQSHVSLNDLCYDWPAGFACFCLTIHNPGRTLTQEEVAQVASILHCQLRQVWRHY